MIKTFKNGSYQAFCPRCNGELFFVYDGKYSVHHCNSGINLHDRDMFNAGARVEYPSITHARNLIKRMIERQEENHDYFDCHERSMQKCK